MATVDDELKQLASLALRNAYFEELQALVAKYRAAAEGLGCDVENGDALIEMSSDGMVLRGDQLVLAEHDALEIWTDGPAQTSFFGRDYRPSTGHFTMLEALTDRPEHDRLGIQGQVVFEKVDGEWHQKGD